MKNRRKGFTLVEYLGIIATIGVLAAALIFASIETVTTARAEKIINDLRMFKAAAFALYADHYDRLNDSAFLNPNNQVESDKAVKELLNDKIYEYIDSKNVKTDVADFSFFVTDQRWYVQYHMPGTDREKRRIHAKLAARARGSELLERTVNGEFLEYTNYRPSTTFVYMFVR